MIVKRLYIFRAPVNIALVEGGKREWLEQHFIPDGMRDLQKNAQERGWKVLEVGDVEISMRDIEPPTDKKKSKSAKKSKKSAAAKAASTVREIIGQFDVTLDMPNEQIFKVVNRND